MLWKISLANLNRKITKIVPSEVMSLVTFSLAHKKQWKIGILIEYSKNS